MMSAFADLLLLWGQQPAPFRQRDARPYEPVFADGGQLWLTANPSPYLRRLGQADCQVWLVGELTGYQQVRFSQQSLQAFLADWLAGSAQPAALNGHFLLFLWQARSRQWHVWTDRLGTFHVYYGANGRQSALGTFFPAVAQAASQRQLDWYGLAGFFSWGFFPQDHTYFEDVRLLRPATHTVFDENGRLCQQNRYWQWQHNPDKSRSYADTVAEFAHIFEKVLGDQTAQGRIALPLSGGLDSRSIAAAVTGHDCTPAQLWAYSYGYTADSIETRLGRQIAQARDLPCQTYTVQPYLFTDLDRVLACVEGFQDVTQCRQAAVAAPLQQHADLVLAGHWGDVWLDDMGLLHPASPDLLAVVRHKLEKKGGGWLLSHFGLRPQVEQLWQQVAAELENYAHLADLDFRVKAFKTDQWSWRWTTASLRMFQAAVFPRLPFYDNRLVDFFSTVPTSFVAGRRLQIDYLKRFAPDLARIAWQPYQANLYRYQHFDTWLLPARAWRKARRILSGREVIARNWEVQFFQGNGRQQLYDALLSRGRRVQEFIPASAMRGLLDNFYQQPDGQTGYTVSMLFTFAAWLEQYG